MERRLTLCRTANADGKNHNPSNARRSGCQGEVCAPVAQFAAPFLVKVGQSRVHSFEDAVEPAVLCREARPEFGRSDEKPSIRCNPSLNFPFKRGDIDHCRPDGLSQTINQLTLHFGPSPARG